MRMPALARSLSKRRPFRHSLSGPPFPLPYKCFYRSEDRIPVNFLHDLRRRRMFRLVGLYIVGAWVVIQVAEALFQAWGIPESAMRFVFIGASTVLPDCPRLRLGLRHHKRRHCSHDEQAGADEVGQTCRLQKHRDYAVLTALVVIGASVIVRQCRQDPGRDRGRAGHYP